VAIPDLLVNIHSLLPFLTSIQSMGFASKYGRFQSKCLTLKNVRTVWVTEHGEQACRKRAEIPLTLLAFAEVTHDVSNRAPTVYKAFLRIDLGFGITTRTLAKGCCKTDARTPGLHWTGDGAT
jgi:hypothetical protein